MISLRNTLKSGLSGRCSEDRKEMEKNLSLQSQISPQLPLSMPRPSNSDTTHLVELLGGQTVLNLCTLFQKFPGTSHSSA